MAAARTAVDLFRVEYNQDRPHQALDDAAPASRFVPVPEQVRAELGLDIPAELLNTRPAPAPAPASVTPEPEPAGGSDVAEDTDDWRQGFLTE